MATKSITIDLKAYERLKSVQKAGESFSEVIHRVVRCPIDLDEWFRRIDEHPMSKKAIAAVEERLRDRSRPSDRER